MGQLSYKPNMNYVLYPTVFARFQLKYQNCLCMS